MGFSVYYGYEDKEPAEGPYLASGTGWVQFCDYVMADPDRFPELAFLAEEGYVAPDELQPEVRELLDAGELPENLHGIAETLWEACRDAPEGAASLVVSDGTDPGEDDDEEADD